MKKTLFAFLLILALCLSGMVACGKKGRGLEFTSNGDGTCSVTGIGKCKDTDLVIPSVSPDGDKVTSIGVWAFKDCDNLKSVTIPDSVTSIGNGAFSECDSLTSVVIPDSVAGISESAFSACPRLTSVVIPDSVTSIGDYAFWGCTGLKSVKMSENVMTIGDNVFYGCGSLIYNEYDNACYVGSESNPYLVLVKAKDTSITSCEINNNTKIICRSAFRDCRDLTSVVIPGSVTSIGIDAFNVCPSLTRVYITDVAAWCNISFGNAFSNPLSWAKDLYLNGGIVTELVIPDGVTDIGDYSFYSCESITKVIIPDTVTSIGYYAFDNCNSLTSVVIPDSVTSIGDSAFFIWEDNLVVYYTGDEEQWAIINIGSNNSDLTDATIVYNYVP